MSELFQALLAEQVTGGEQRRCIAGVTVNRAEVAAGAAVEILGPDPAGELVVELPAAPEILDRLLGEDTPALVVGFAKYRERGEN